LSICLKLLIALVMNKWGRDQRLLCRMTPRVRLYPSSWTKVNDEMKDLLGL